MQTEFFGSNNAVSFVRNIVDFKILTYLLFLQLFIVNVFGEMQKAQGHIKAFVPKVLRKNL
jgi:hypothetical protein